MTVERGQKGSYSIRVLWRRHWCWACDRWTLHLHRRHDMELHHLLSKEWRA